MLNIFISHARAYKPYIDELFDLGIDFAKVIDRQVSQCGVVLVVIGKDWTSVAGSDGRPRLKDSSDFVRIEVEKALSRDM